MLEALLREMIDKVEEVYLGIKHEVHVQEKALQDLAKNMKSFKEESKASMNDLKSLRQVRNIRHVGCRGEIFEVCTALTESLGLPDPQGFQKLAKDVRKRDTSSKSRNKENKENGAAAQQECDPSIFPERTRLSREELLGSGGITDVPSTPAGPPPAVSPSCSLSSPGSSASIATSPSTATISIYRCITA